MYKEQVKEIEKKWKEFDEKLQALLDEYNIIIYAANVLLDNWEVVPMIKKVYNGLVEKEDGKESEEVTVVA